MESLAQGPVQGRCPCEPLHSVSGSGREYSSQTHSLCILSFSFRKTSLRIHPPDTPSASFQDKEGQIITQGDPFSKREDRDPKADPIPNYLICVVLLPTTHFRFGLIMQIS